MSNNDHRCDVCGKFPKKQRRDLDVYTCTPCGKLIARTEARAKRMFGE